VGAIAPTRYGPQPASAGPIPQGWPGGAAPGTTAAPGAATTPTPVGGGATAPGGSAAGGVILSVVVILVTLGAVIGLYGWRRRQDAAEA
jgi:hypothetical protein